MASNSNTTSSELALKSAKEKVKMERKKRWTESEVFVLCEFVKQNRAVLFGSDQGHGVGPKRKKAWEEAGKEVEKTGQIHRGGSAEIRSKWNDLVYRAKKYRTKRLGKETGGGPQETKNPTFEAVLDVLPDEIVAGILDDSIETAPILVEDKETQQGHQSTSTIKVEVEPDVYTASSQEESSQSQDTKKAQIGKSRKRKLVKKENKANDKKSNEVSLFDMNKRLLEIEEKKLKYKEEKLQQQRELIDVLKSINGNIEKLLPPVSSIDLDLLNVQMEQ